jgi:hypothetical protein
MVPGQPLRILQAKEKKMNWKLQNKSWVRCKVGEVLKYRNHGMFFIFIIFPLEKFQSVFEGFAPQKILTSFLN